MMSMLLFGFDDNTRVLVCISLLNKSSFIGLLIDDVNANKQTQLCCFSLLPFPTFLLLIIP